MVGPAVIQQFEVVPDEAIVSRILAGETALFEILMRRHNQQVYRAARAVLRNESEAEDVMQDAYVRAFVHLDQFEGRAKFSTWLIRIAVNEALARRKRQAGLTEFDTMTENSPLTNMSPSGPEFEASRSQVRILLQAAIEELPEALRIVFLLRCVQELSTSETASVLELTEENVKIRLHRAKAALRRRLAARVGDEARYLYSFDAERCDRIVAAVSKRIGAE